MHATRSGAAAAHPALFVSVSVAQARALVPALALTGWPKTVCCQPARSINHKCKHFSLAPLARSALVCRLLLSSRFERAHIRTRPAPRPAACGWAARLETGLGCARARSLVVVVVAAAARALGQLGARECYSSIRHLVYKRTGTQSDELARRRSSVSLALARRARSLSSHRSLCCCSILVVFVCVFVAVFVVVAAAVRLSAASQRDP
jgi:hypothetical protein